MEHARLILSVAHVNLRPQPHARAHTRTHTRTRTHTTSARAQEESMERARLILSRTMGRLNVAWKHARSNHMLVRACGGGVCVVSRGARLHTHTVPHTHTWRARLCTTAAEATGDDDGFYSRV
jgi:hypothetical protein